MWHFAERNRRAGAIQSATGPGRDAGFPEPLAGFKPTLGENSGGNTHSPVTTGYSLASLRYIRI